MICAVVGRQYGKTMTEGCSQKRIDLRAVNETSANGTEKAEHERLGGEDKDMRDWA